MFLNANTTELAHRNSSKLGRIVLKQFLRTPRCSNKKQRENYNITPMSSKQAGPQPFTIVEKSMPTTEAI